MKTPYLKGLAALTVTTSLTALSTPAFAQLDEIIVTAEKKAENLQDVPIVIQAFDLESLENNRIEGLEDIGTFTPGVYVTPNPADPSGVRINIRGVGTLDPQVGQDSRVAVYQDGVYLGKTQGLALDLPDLARIEVLKGPQGTLYGRNTVAGAVNLISARPDPSELSGKFDVEYGNFDHMKASGAVNIPLAETAAFRLSGLFLHRDGWVENDGPGVNFGGEKKYGIRGVVGFDVGDNFNLEFAGDFNKTEKEPLFAQSITDFGAGLFANAISTFDDGRQEQVTTSFTNEEGDLETRGVSITGRWDIAENHDLKITAAYRDIESSRFVALIPTADPNIVSAITGGFNQALGALPSAFEQAGQPLRPDFSTQFDNSIPDRGLFLSPPGGSIALQDHNQFSLEATYNGEFADGRVEYTGGAFYFNEETGQPAAQNFANANDYLFVLGAFDPRLTPQSVQDFLNPFLAPLGIDPLGPIPAAGALDTFARALPPTNPLGMMAQANLERIVGGPNTPFNVDPRTVFNQLAAARQTTTNSLFIDTQAFAIYGQATWHVTDDFRITGGLRYSDESKDGVGQTNSAFFNDNLTLTGDVILPNIASFDDTVLDPSLTLEYDFNDDVLLYASYKESFRSGGFNSTAAAIRSPGETFGPDFTFGLEEITAYEAGFKGDFGDRFRLNAAAFYYDFKDKQTTFALNPLIATERALVNTDDEIYGFEADSLFVLNDEFTLRGSYAYIDGEPGDTVSPIDPTDIRTFDEIQGTPKHSGLVGLDYDGGNGFFGSVTYSYKDDVLAIPESQLRFPSISLVNGRIGYDFEMANGNQATIAVWGTNLFDEEYLIDSLPFESFALRTQTFGQPRSYGATLGIRF